MGLDLSTAQNHRAVIGVSGDWLHSVLLEAGGFGGKNVIKCIAVIGAGTMGAGIAAHAANSGVNVILLDVETSLARGGVDKQLKLGGFMAPNFADQVQVGSITENLDLLATADWIIEAAAESLDIKHGIYRAIDGVRKSDAIVSSNTSTIPLEELTRSMSPRLAERFLITHFFNPPRTMRLLEVVAGPATDQSALLVIRDFADKALGKSLVDCNDRPGFIANRIGSFWMLLAQQEAIRIGLDIEDADMLMTAAFGIPRSGIFGLLDLIGLDVMAAIRANLQARLPSNDALVLMGKQPDLVERIASEGRLGRKSGAGFYRFQRDSGIKEALDLTTGDYRLVRRPGTNAARMAEKGPRALMESDGAAGRFASYVMRQALSYAVSLIPEIAETPHHVDRAMTLGYGWKHGPFELMDRMGASWFADHLHTHGETVPAFLERAADAGGFYPSTRDKATCLKPDGGLSTVDRAAGVLSLPTVRGETPAIQHDDFVSLWDMGDGVAMMEMHAKMNVLSEPMLAGLSAGLARATDSFCALVIATEGAHFSVGADLKSFLHYAENREFSRIAAMIDAGQNLMQSLKFSAIPVIAAGHGMALGGGCELALHSAAIAAHAEFNIGLVETSVGLVPAWGGCKELLLRFSENAASLSDGTVAPAIAAFNVIAKARKATNAFEARELCLLSAKDCIVMNIERVIAEAKSKAITLSKTYRPPEQQQLRLAGPAGALVLRNAVEVEFDGGRITEHERFVGGILADILTGGPSADPMLPSHENAIFDLEKAAILELLQTEATLERIKQMLAKAKR